MAAWGQLEASVSACANDADAPKAAHTVTPVPTHVAGEWV